MQRNKAKLTVTYRVHAIRAWHQRALGRCVFAVLELVVLYGSVSVAIARGNVWYYLASLILVVGVIQNVTGLFVLLIRTLRHA